MKFLILAILAVLVLAGCSLLPAQYSAIEEGAAQITVQSSERAICRDLPIGAWIKLYGMSSSRLTGWQNICFNPVTTPLNDATIQAILKAYPNANVAAPQPLIAPSVTPPSTPPVNMPTVAPVAAPVSAPPAVSAPASKKATAKPVAAAAPIPAPTVPTPAPAIAPVVVAPAQSAMPPSALPGQ